ncbi:MAG: hypothetical protein ACI9UR_001557 [Bacteroidia bacterium]|jgi:hypothetical protein
MPHLREDLLQHIWQHRLFDSQNLKTTEGFKVEVIRPGELNSNAGPDFLNSRLKIGETEWAGNVEIHVRASDWLRHKHQHDSNYENIILHVVFENDLEESLGTFPTLELKNLISNQVLTRYDLFVNASDEVPCGKQFMEVPALIRNGWMDTLVVSRLQRKSEWIDQNIDENAGDLEQAFQVVLFRAFGMKVNSEPFELLAKNTLWKVLAKHQNNLLQLEAILFGNAGFLENPEYEYQAKLSKEYEFLRHKYGLEPMDRNLWKFSRMHPKNFPSLRIGQLAALFFETGAFFKWFGGKDVPDLLSALMIEPSQYWQTHYRFGKEFPTVGNRLGMSMAQNILINVLAPFLFILSERETKMELKEQAMALLEQLKPESNKKTRPFAKFGFRPNNAMESQALIELKTNFCDHKKCINCRIGANILKRES